MKNTFGSDLSLTIFGESHGRAIGAVLDGMAAGLPVDEAFLAACMDKRRARGDGLSTPRVEADTVQLLSGVVNGRTTGTAIALMIENTNTRSGDYAKTADLLRPGHADYTAYAKYHGFQDARGGGHFSGRVTAALVAGGAIVLSALHRAGIDITTHIAECAGIADTRFAQDDAAQLSAQVEALASKPEGFAVLDETVEEPMKAAIRAAGAEGDSVGGMLETAILGLPAGIGEPYFDSVESEIAHLVFSVPAVKGIEFGTGFGFAGMRGSEANDAFRDLTRIARINDKMWAELFAALETGRAWCLGLLCRPSSSTATGCQIVVGRCGRQKDRKSPANRGIVWSGRYGRFGNFLEKGSGKSPVPLRWKVRRCLFSHHIRRSPKRCGHSPAS